MGASMAQHQLRALFSELLSAFPAIEVGEPRYLVGNFVNGVSRLEMDTGSRREAVSRQPAPPRA